VNFKLYFIHFCPPALLTLGPARFRRFLVDHAPFNAVQDLKGIVDIMYKTSVDIINSKRRALEEGDEETERQVARGKDILSILCEFFYFSCFIWRERVTFLG
jgi:hypothetical protein